VVPGVDNHHHRRCGYLSKSAVSAVTIPLTGSAGRAAVISVLVLTAWIAAAGWAARRLVPLGSAALGMRETLEG
jgi:hypothetical protein